MPANAFETGQRKVIPAVLVYAKRDGRILMLHRNAKENDYHEGKWNGLGGKCEPDESALEAAQRELKEESGLDLALSTFRTLGWLHFPNFKASKAEDWMVTVFEATVPPGQGAWEQGPEGDLVWIPQDEILRLNLWDGDRHFLPYVVQGVSFAGTIWYQGQKVTRYQIETLR